MNQSKLELMSQTPGIYILIFLILALVILSGCIVPTKETTTSAASQSSGINYLVPGTGSGSTQPSRFDARTQGTPGMSPTVTPIPDDTRYLTPVPAYVPLSVPDSTYRNLSVPVEPTQMIPQYKEIYHHELSLQADTVAYAYDLTNPPLIIYFDIKPKQYTRTLWYESRMGTYDSNGRRPDVFVTTQQPSPNAWFEVILRDKRTGNIVIDDGLGKNFGGDTTRTVQVRSSGSYRIDMSGNEVNVTVRMYIVNGTA